MSESPARAAGAVMSLREPLRHRAFRWLAAGRTANYLGNGIAPVALAFAVLDLTGSVVDLGVVVGVRSVATVILLLFGGVLADRLPRALILQGAMFAGAATQAAIAGSVLLHFASVPLLAGLSAVNGAVTAASMPASSALTPQTVPAGLVRTANAVARIGVNTGLILGSSCGGLIAALAGPGWAISLSALAFLGSAACNWRLRGRIRDVPRQSGDDGMLTQLRDGWREFTARQWVWLVVAQFMIVNAAIVGGIQVIGPAVADGTIGRTGWGLVLAAQTVGAVVGGFVAARWQPRHALFVGVALTLVEAIPLVLLAVVPQVVVLASAMFVAGVTMEQFGVAWDVSLQEHIPEDRLARVYSYDALGSFLAIPIGQITIGPVADSVGASPTLIGTAALVIGATAATLLSRSVRSLTHGSAGPQAGQDDGQGVLAQVGAPAGADGTAAGGGR